MATISVRISGKLLEELAREREISGLTCSMVVREALAAYFARLESDDLSGQVGVIAVELEKVSKRLSFVEEAAGL
jgi:hypothetical protein